MEVVWPYAGCRPGFLDHLHLLGLQLSGAQAELELYASALASVPAIVVANKVDTLGDGGCAAITGLRQHTHLPVHAVSALNGSGTQSLLQCIGGCQPPSMATKQPALLCQGMCQC